MRDKLLVKGLVKLLDTTWCPRQVLPWVPPMLVLFWHEPAQVQSFSIVPSKKMLSYDQCNYYIPVLEVW